MQRVFAAAVGRLLRALAALVVLAALVGGIPGLLALFAGWPLSFIGWAHPGSVPGLSALVAAITNPWSDQMIVGLLATFGWLLWAVFVRDVIAEILYATSTTAAGRGQYPPRTPRRGPLRWVAAILVGAILSATVAGGLRAALTSGPASYAADAAARRPAVAVAPASAPARLVAHIDTTPALAPTGESTSATLRLSSRHHPSGAVPAWANNAPGGVHHVVAGDNLWDIAAHTLGDPHRWREIYVLNRHQPQADGYRLTDPDQIHIGWILALPAQHTTGSHPQTPPADGSAPPPATPPPVTAPTAPPASPGAPTAATPRSGAAPSTTAPAATTTPSSTAVPSAAPSTTPASAARPEHTTNEHAHGIHLPAQGWISLGLAATIAATTTLLRLQRRRAARLRFPIDVGTEPQPTPVPPSLSTVDAVGSRHLDMDTEDSTLPGLLPAPPPTPAPIGINAHGREVSLFDLPGPGLALVGPGAEPATRAVLAAALSTGVVQYLAARPVVVTTADTLRRLLPPGHEPVGLDPDEATYDGERLLVLSDAGAVVTRAEEEMIHRRRLLDTMGGESLRELNARDDHAEHQPPIVLLAEPDSRQAARLLAIAAHRHALDIHPVVLGVFDGLPNVLVDGYGTVGSAPGAPPPGGLARVATLGAPDLVHVLSLVARVAPRPEPGTTPGDEAPVPVPGSGSPAVPVEIPARDGQASPLVHLQVLGPVAATTSEGPIGTGMRSGSYGVLAMLAAHPKGRTLDQLATGLYPDGDPDTRHKRVRTDINTTRRVLRQATATPGAKFILFHPGTGLYRLDPEAVDVDLWRMLATLQRANAAVDDDTACLAALREATECYGGDFATGQDRAWATDYATTFRHQILSAYARIAEILETDHPDQAASALETAIEHDPVNEELYQRLIRIQGRLGRPDAVRRTLRLLENRLADLGEAEVSEATRRIAARQLHPATTGSGMRG